MKKTLKSNCENLKIVATKSDFPKVKIYQSRDSYEFIKKFYETDIEIYESFYLLLLNRANTTTGYVKISQGGTAGTVADVKIIAKYAVDSLSSAVILAHNHPSGNLKPSESDIQLTKKVREALRLFDIDVFDHIILTSENGYYSFADEGIF